MNGKDNYAIDARNISKTYYIHKNKIEALKKVDFKVKRSEFVAIVGPSGSGKSTLLSMVGGLGRPSSGRIWIDGVEITRGFIGAEFTILPAIRRLKMGFVFQFFNLIPTLTALENVMLPMEFTKTLKYERKERALDLLEQVGMSHRLKHKPSELSGGEQQRVAVARALANNPPILLADEPTGNLDSKTGRELIEILLNLNEEQDQTLVVTTHDLRVAKMAHRIIYIKDGQVMKEMLPSEELVGKEN